MFLKNYLFIMLIFFTACSKQHLARVNMPQSLGSGKLIESSFDFKAQKYKKSFFTPWFFKKDFYEKGFKTKLIKSLFWQKSAFYKDFFFYNHQKIPKSFIAALKKEANFKDFLKINKNAILKRNTLLRALPSEKALLLNPLLEGEGLPFDHNLIARLNYASPLYVSHYSEDRSFAYVKSELGWGFIPTRAFDFVDEDFIKTYLKQGLITSFKDEQAIYSIDESFVFRAKIGAIFAFTFEDEHNFYLKLKNDILIFPKESFAPFPLPTTYLKMLLEQMLGQAYGWGGYAGNRDCSSFIKDLFASFGLYLPRNSAAQASLYPQIFLDKMQNKAKEDFILKYAKPFLSLLYMRGHILLYAGKSEGKARVIQQIWGIKTKQNKRLFIGKLVLSDLHIEEQNKRVAFKDLLITRLKSLVFLEKKGLIELLNQPFTIKNKKIIFKNKAYIKLGSLDKLKNY